MASRCRGAVEQFLRVQGRMSENPGQTPDHRSPPTFERHQVTSDCPGMLLHDPVQPRDEDHLSKRLYLAAARPATNVIDSFHWLHGKLL